MPEFFVKSPPYDFVDIRDDSIMLFFGIDGWKSDNKQHHFYVKLNAVIPGNYTLSGAYTEAMYDDTYRALSESEKVVVEP